MQNRIYIYGIIKTDNPQEFGAIGIENAGSASNVTTIGYKDVAAVVSTVPFVSYNSLAQEKTLKDLATHQLVIEKVMARFTILPVKFGTTLETREDIITFLEKGYTLLSNQLVRMDGKIELDLVAWWEISTILPVISRRNSQIQAKQQEINAKGQNISLEDKIALGQYISQAVEDEKARCQQLILQALTLITEDMCPHDLATDQMIFNSAFLLAKANEERFHNTLQSLDQTLEELIHFREVGPLPPYSFSTILFQKIEPEDVEEAKKTLGLSGELNEQTIRDAYYQLAKKYHPDTRTQKDTAEFQGIHAAYRTLNNFLEQGTFSIEVYDWQKDF